MNSYQFIAYFVIIYPIFLCQCRLPQCGSRAEVYLIEGQVVEVKVRDTRQHRSSLLVINSCDITISSTKPADFDLAHTLINITTLSVEGVMWPSLPEDNQLEKVSFTDVTPLGKFGGCPVLKNMSFVGGNFSNIAPTWLHNCPHLKQITLMMSIYFKQDMHHIVYSAPQLEELTISGSYSLNHFEKYPIFINSTHQNLTKVDFRAKSESVKNSNGSRVVLAQFALLPRLEHLEICSYNFNICESGGFSKVILPSLKSLQLCALPGSTTQVCFRQYLVMPVLESFQIQCFGFYQPIFYAKFAELQSTLDQNLTVKMLGSRERSLCELDFEFTRENYLQLANSFHFGKASFNNTKLRMECDCAGNYLWLLKANRSKLINAPTVTCKNSDKYLQCERLDCKRVPCPGECVCCRIGPKDEFIADCRGANLTALPEELLRLRNLTELLATNNHISTLPKALPKNLKLLDLARNNISDLFGSSALFAVRQRRWRLSGNPFLCTCTLFDIIQYRIEQIDDTENVECSGELGPFKTLIQTCKERQREILLTQEISSEEEREHFLILSVVMTTVLAFIAIVIGIAFNYRQTIQFILFAHGCCLCWLAHEDNGGDNERPFDVFLSFCHEDTDVVLNEMLPMLEHYYSVCVHLRDWVPGNMIPANIRLSVKRSKRTLIILSKNFAKSQWGLMEFQTAYASSLDEKRIRVVMVILGDVLEMEDLNVEFKEYVRFNTYVKWGDPWFWSKLRYALPHKNAFHRDVQSNQSANCSEPALRVRCQEILALEAQSVRIVSLSDGDNAEPPE